MEAKTFKGMWKAIVFLTTVATVLFSCSACEPEEVPVVYEPSIKVSVENVRGTSATLVAEVCAAGQNLEVQLEYFTDNSWQKIDAGRINGQEKQIIKKELTGLSPEKSYQLRGSLILRIDGAWDYAATGNTVSFKTLKQSELRVIKTVSDYDFIEVEFELIPRWPNTKVELEYQGIVKGSNVYSGDQAVTFTIKMDKLAKNTIYPVKMKVNNEGGFTVDTTFQTAAVEDYDGNKYCVVTIGTQTFIKENLKTTHFLNGDPIPNITNDDQWITLTTPAYCYYNNDPEMGKKYGALYNWYVASDPRGLIEGFHVPTEEEYSFLVNYLGGESCGGAMKTTTLDWKQPNVGATNTSGFSALPAGIRRDWKEVDPKPFSYLGEGTTFWTGKDEPRLPGLTYSPTLSFKNSGFMMGGLNFFNSGFSIRLIKN